MKKNLLYTSLGLMGLMGALVIGVVNADNEFIIHNAAAGTITIYTGDYSYGITIQDKNLGATNVNDCKYDFSICSPGWEALGMENYEQCIQYVPYFGFDELSCTENMNGYTDIQSCFSAIISGYNECSLPSYGYYYQWGNNNGNPGNAEFSTDLLVRNSGYDNKGYDGINNGIIIPWSGDDITNINRDLWTDNELHDNVWGGGNDNDDSNPNIVKGYNKMEHIATNVTGRQGPCPEGYHVPSAGEWNELMMLRCNANSDTCSGSMIGNAGNKYGEEHGWANYIEVSAMFSNDLLLPLAGCFDSEFNLEFVLPGQIGYYWSSSPRGESVSISAWRLGFMMGDAIHSSYYATRVNGESLRCFKNFYVKFPKTLNVSFISEDGEVGTGEVTEDKAFTGTIPSVTKDEYNLEYRYLSGADTSTGFDFENTPISGAWADENGNIYFVVQWNPIEYTIAYELDGGTNSENNVTGYTIETPDITLENHTKDGYSFDGWFADAEFTTGVTIIPTGTTGNITLYAKWTENKKPSGGSSGGGGRKTDTNTQKEDKTGADTGNVIQSETKGSEESSDTPIDSSADASEGQNYSEEFQGAYKFAKEKGITTMPTINDANMNGKFTRIAMAKMLSYYAINVLGQKPANIIIPKFNDVTDKQNSDYDDGVTLAYQLGIMGQNMRNNKFRPNDEVTRAEFATALSRMIYHTSDGEYKSTPKYYIHHMEKLVKEGIITKDDPNMKELRGYVMIMLMRSAK